MEEKLGPVSYEHDRPSFLAGAPSAGGWQERRFSDATAHAIDEAVQRIVERAFARTVAILERQREALEHGAALLLEKETLDEPALQQLRAGMKPPEPAVAAQ
jgi:cell division protease FtsH